MNSNPVAHSGIRFIAIIRVLALPLVMLVAVGVPAHGITQYSGASVGANGTIYGWGVTDAYQPGMWHTAYATTRLTSPGGRVANSGQWSGSNWVQANVSLPWLGTDVGYYTVNTDHSYYCPYLMALIPLVATTASKNVIPPILLCSSAPRGITTNCTVTDSLGIWSMSEWKFIDGALITNRTPTSSSTTWLGTAVKSGVVSVKATGPDIRTLTWLLVVTARSGWAFNAVSAAKVANGAGTGACTGQLPLLPNPPVVGSDVGYSCLAVGAATYVTNTVAAGPNAGYKYNTSSGPNSSLYQWERVPDLDNTGSLFYTKQTGTYNAGSNPNGCISGFNLASQTQRHEIGLAQSNYIQSHWNNYKTAQDSPSNNYGTIIEAKVGLPSQSTTEFQNELNTALLTSA